MAVTSHKTAFVHVFPQIVLLLFMTASSAHADHFHKDKYKEKNQILFDKTWARANDELENQRDKNEGIVFYSGFAMWGDESWSLGDAEKIGTALEQFYDGSQHLNFIFSNEEENNLPKDYPTVMDNILREHFARLSIKAKKTDLVVVGLYSHGGKGKLQRKLGSTYKDYLTVGKLKRFMSPLENHNVLLIISACYSGSFIEKLKNEKHVIATAAASDKTSNGCSPLHHQTYYGQALVEAFNSFSDSTETDILKVLKSAVSIINKKEKWKKDKSEPQLFVGNEFNVSM